MAEENLDFGYRRLKFIEACAYYIRIMGVFGDVDRLEMTVELASLITERFRAANLEWSIYDFKQYKSLLDDGMDEQMPDIGDRAVNKANVLRYNFRSLVAKEVNDKSLLFKKDAPCKSKKPTSNDDVNANGVPQSPSPKVVESWRAKPSATPHSQSPKVVESPAKPSATPHDFLKGFSVYIKPDVHLDDMIPICARDQHLLFNVFGDKWKSPLVLEAYEKVKGQTGFMPKWTSNGNN